MKFITILPIVILLLSQTEAKESVKAKGGLSQSLKDIGKDIAKTVGKEAVGFANKKAEKFLGKGVNGGKADQLATVDTNTNREATPLTAKSESPDTHSKSKNKKKHSWGGKGKGKGKKNSPSKAKGPGKVKGINTKKSGGKKKGHGKGKGRSKSFGWGGHKVGVGNISIGNTSTQTTQPGDQSPQASQASAGTLGQESLAPGASKKGSPVKGALNAAAPKVKRTLALALSQIKDML
ncbi:hypothetical protein K502DRAFT_352933 [Neoconidiobolus thromboides FSU 785]|nr:hypothetical protein K502DRAFT_352933 [Neoconidiobolus thromboides FSU 785]